ncbi:hypothetical protein DTO012A8_10221 [Penicillium roqueforti]|nr:hypothetical protein DTO012A8_10221 [Penicillium roqueforti]
MVSPAIRVAPSAANRALNLLRTVQYSHPPNCPCHKNPSHHHNHKQTSSLLNHVKRRMSTPIDPSREKEYAFEMAASSIRFGPGATKEVGMDFTNLGAKRVCIVTDSNVAKLDAMKQAFALSLRIALSKRLSRSLSPINLMPSWPSAAAL